MNYSRTFQVGKKENERYNLYSIKRKTLIMSMIVFIAITIMVTFEQLKSNNTVFFALLTGIGLGLAGIVFFNLVNIFLIKYKLYSSYKSGKIKAFKQHIMMNESGIHAKTDHGSVDVPFHQISGVQETRQAYYIFITTGQTYVYPKDQMKGETEFQKVRSVFKENIPVGKLRLRV